MRFLESVYFQEIIILVLDYSQVTSKKKQKKSDNGDFSIDESSRPNRATTWMLAGYQC